MKLRLIAEGSIREMRHQDEADAVALQQSLKNLQLSTMLKLRNWLDGMGLSKGKEKHRVTEPLPVAVSAFDSLRRAVQRRLQEHSQLVMLHGPESDQARAVEQYWGFRFPANWYDAQRGQMGKSAINGHIDKILGQAKKQARSYR